MNKSATHEYQYVDEADFSLKKKKKKGQEGGMQDVTGHTQSLSLDNERARMDLTFFSTMHVVM